MYQMKKEQRSKIKKSCHSSFISWNSGITLIVLIITIVVLLILAVVAIRAVQGDGIIAHAKNASDNYNQAQADENATLEDYLV